MLFKEFDAATTPIEGHMLLEASAGTGKTYSLMRVLLRLLVEKGIELDRILVVTFTNAATDELSSRLRSNLTELIEQIRLKKNGSFNDLLIAGKKRNIVRQKFLKNCKRRSIRLTTLPFLLFTDFASESCKTLSFLQKGTTTLRSAMIQMRKIKR